MIAYLPEIYPDELVYSWFCRFYVHSGCINHKMALQEILYKKCNNPSKEFLGHLNPEMKQMIEQLYTTSDLIINHTMYPQYARFIPLKQKEKALYHMKYDFCDTHQLFTILPRDKADQYMKYCPLCVVEDRKLYGETYWHRTHQIRNMCICPKHKCNLINSNITAKSEQTFTLNSAETSIKNMEIQYSNNSSMISYIEYLAKVFHTPFDFENDVPISAVLYNFMSKTKYLKSTRKSRYTKQFADDIKAYYENIGVNNIVSMSQIQKTLLSEKTEFSTVCQIAFYLDISVQDLTSSILTNEQIEQERNSHYMRDAEIINWNKYDAELAPLLEKIIRNIYDGTASKIGRPERVSEKIVCREMNINAHRLKNMPKCKAIFEKYTESYPENWTRKIIWAYKKLKSENENLPFYWSDIRKLTGVKKENIDKIIPYLIKYTGKEFAEEIMKIIKI